MTTLAEIKTDLQTGIDPEWRAKMIHVIPDAPSVDRVEFIGNRCRGKVVLSFGCTGPMQVIIDAVCTRCFGVDCEPLDRSDFTRVDLDNISHEQPLPVYGNIELVVVGEVLEHLANPGRFLADLRASYTDRDIIITVPNAFATAGAHYLAKGIECVNRDHVAWYSYHTLKVLVERYGFTVVEWYWYNGTPRFAEGLIFVLR